MVSVASQLIEEVTAHAQSDSLEDAQEICADSTYFLNNLRVIQVTKFYENVFLFHSYESEQVIVIAECVDHRKTQLCTILTRY